MPRGCPTGQVQWVGVGGAARTGVLLGACLLTGTPLLVLHGTPDQVFLIENARALHENELARQLMEDVPSASLIYVTAS